MHFDSYRSFFNRRPERPLAHRKIGAIVYGRWSDASDGTAAGMVGEDVIVCRRNETSIEVHCHGGVAASERIVGDLTEVGATAEKWTTWVERHEASRISAPPHVSRGPLQNAEDGHAASGSI